MYLDEIASEIRRHIPTASMPDGDVERLLRLYAVLLRAKGTGVTEGDVHDAWSAWMSERNPRHESLVPFGELTAAVRKEDGIFVTAIRKAAEKVSGGGPTTLPFTKVLFPFGPPDSGNANQQTLDLYKMMVQSSEGLVSRRQGVNTFFLTMNGALLTASGLFVQNFSTYKFGGLGIFVLGVTGAILCLAWRSLITSFGQLNRGKFKVINTIEQHLSTAIYAAEWEALGRGEDRKTYQSFTSREIWVPNALLILHGLTALIAISVYFGWLTLK